MAQALFGVVVNKKEHELLVGDSENAARAFGLRAGTPMIVGLMDGSAGMLRRLLRAPA